MRLFVALELPEAVVAALVATTMRRLLPLVLLLVAAPAHAVTLEKGVDVQGLALGGERVVTTNVFGAVLSQALDPRSPPFVVLPLDRCNTQEGADIAASDRLVAVASPCEHEDGTGRPPVAGPLGGPLRALAACAAGRDGIATADTRVAFIDRCGGGGPVAVVRDVTTGAQQRVAIGGANVSTVRLRLAGATLVTVAGSPARPSRCAPSTSRPARRAPRTTPTSPTPTSARTAPSRSCAATVRSPAALGSSSRSPRRRRRSGSSTASDRLVSGSPAAARPTSAATASSCSTSGPAGEHRAARSPRA